MLGTGTSAGSADPPGPASDRTLLGLDRGVAGTVSDTITVVHVPAGGPVTALASPPDHKINWPPCRHWDQAAATYAAETVPAEARSGIDSAYDVGGPRCAVRVIQQLTGLAIIRSSPCWGRWSTRSAACRSASTVRCSTRCWARSRAVRASPNSTGAAPPTSSEPSCPE
ncbi:hypothetical protein [Pseudonocardia asaccharolytica]|uniref:hypothetical protein n=1 Tax=Pseudonocardia asaccharolytica TaxID=54010 RepID=UPI0004024924|nr:hypothetical protein [Pseudonocardia asaccharolytica]